MFRDKTNGSVDLREFVVGCGQLSYSRNVDEGYLGWGWISV